MSLAQFVRTRYTDLIGIFAVKNGLDADLLEALVICESGGKAHAHRFEPKFWSRYLAKLPEFKDAIPERVSSSYGLCQLMFTTACEEGFLGEPEQLFDIRTNLALGAKHLRRLLDFADGFDISKEEKLRVALASFNGGKQRPGELRPQCTAYADRVLATYEALRERP